MKNTRSALPWLGTPFIGIIVNSFHMGVVQQRGVDGLFFTLAAEKVFGEVCEDNANANLVAVPGQSFDNFRDYGARTWSVIYSSCAIQI